MAADLMGRIMRRTKQTGNGCLIWQGAHSNGYGFIRTGSRGINRRVERVHRVVWYLTRGPIEDGMEISHTCGQRDCVEPSHLLKMEHPDVIARGQTGSNNREVTTCPQGHEYSEENTMRRSDGRRVCRTCLRERARQARQAKKAGAIEDTRVEVEDAVAVSA